MIVGGKDRYNTIRCPLGCEQTHRDYEGEEGYKVNVHDE